MVVTLFRNGPNKFVHTAGNNCRIGLRCLPALHKADEKAEQLLLGANSTNAHHVARLLRQVRRVGGAPPCHRKFVRRSRKRIENCAKRYRNTALRSVRTMRSSGVAAVVEVLMTEDAH